MSQPADKNFIAAIHMVIAMIFFTSSDALVKLLSAGLPLGQLLFVRGIMVCALLTLLMKLQKQRILSRQLFNPWNLLRGLSELGIAYSFLYGLFLLPLGTATTLIFTGPILLTILAAWILHEHVGWRRWAAVCCGFLGVVLVADPSASQWNWAVLFPLLAALLTAIRDIIIRYVPVTLTSLQVTLTTAWIVTLGGLISYPLDLSMGWNTLDNTQLLWLALSALLICVAYLTYVLATRSGDLSFVAPFKYVTIPVAMFIGYWLWNDVPSKITVIGACVVISSGLFIFFRQNKQRERSSAAN